MYSSRGSGAYGQSYTGQSAYGQNLSGNYSGASSVGGHDATQHSAASRHSSILGGSQDADLGGYRAHTSVAQYGGQYSSVYGSAALSTAQVPSLSTKGAASSALDGRGGYSLGVSDSPKFTSGDYVSSSSHGYGHKSDQLYGDKSLDYSGIDRRQYGERQSYIGRDISSDPTGRYAPEAVGYSGHQQADIYDRIDQATLLRREQLLKSQSLQAASLEGSTRQADYLAARAAASRHPAQDLMSYGGRIDSDPHASSMLSATSYSGQHAPSILGAAPRRNVDDLLYSQNASNPGYGVSLPPGRDYASGKGLQGNAMELDFPGGSDRKDDRASYLREFELREEERRRERLRDRDRDRDKDKERERVREREREREKERMLERREKERERERKRALEVRVERTPVRSSKDPRGTSKDPRGSSLTKEGRSSRRDSPHHGASHRHHSPVKEKRREYVCKVYPSCLVNIERDYLSIDKRYPRLFIPPEFSKAVVNWPKEDLKLSIHTPVSFEHDFVEEITAKPKDSSSKLLAGQPSEKGKTIWNAKILLMSGLSRSALEELSSDKFFDDRVPHICNILRFAVLKKDHSFMAVGGPWEASDGGDPSDDSSLIQTALRHTKDVIQLDLQKCHHWNRFLEIHYDRIGKDGFFSHKEITVLYVPNLSDCLPSFDEWRGQWLAHMKAVAEREHQISLKKQKSKDSKESKGKADKRKDSAASGQSDVKKKDKDSNPAKEKNEDKTGVSNNTIAKKDASNIGEGKTPEKKQGGNTTGQTLGPVKSVKKKVIKRVVKQKVANKANDSAKKPTDKSGEKVVEEKVAASDVPDQENKSSVDPTGIQISGKDLVVEDVAVGKTDGEEENNTETNSIETKPQEKLDPTVNAGTNIAAVKTTIKKKIIKRVPKKKVVSEASKSVVSDSKNEEGNAVTVQAQDGTASTGKQTADADATVIEVKKPVKVVPKKKLKSPTSGEHEDAADSSKTTAKSGKKDDENVVGVQAKDDTLSTGKQTGDADATVIEVKKPVKVVPKKKLKSPTSGEQEDTVDSSKTITKSDKKDDENVVGVQAKDDTPSSGKQTADADTKVTLAAKKIGKVVPKKKLKAPASRKQEGAGDSSKTEMKSDKDDKKDEKGSGEKSGANIDKQKASEKDTKNTKGKLKDGDKSKEEKVTKEKGGKDEPKSKSSKQVKEKRKSDEPPRPGFILQTKCTKDSKLRSLSLSLDSLLDYTDKDVEESTLELSLFAEAFYEMLQFQMGCRILAFLQVLRQKFVIKRTQRKRQREDGPEKDVVNKSPAKRAKGDDSSVKSEPNMDTSNPALADNEKTVAENDNSSDKKDDVKMEDSDKKVDVKIEESDKKDDVKMEDASEDEDPEEEEDPEEYEEMENGSPQNDSSDDKNAAQEESKVKDENISSNEKEKAADETLKVETKVKDELKESKADVKLEEEKEGKGDKSKKETPPAKEVVVDKELLKAFRFFDRNRAGYIRVEDMRIVLHNLGMFLSHRDVKELVQSALLESNTGRDDRILYTKLVRMNEL